METLDPEALRQQVHDLENRQALYGEYAYIAFRLARIYEERSYAIEQERNELCRLLTHLIEAEHVYGRGCDANH